VRILHFIESLNYGGAETLLMSYLPLLPNDEHFVVTLHGPNVYGKNNYEYTELNMKPVRSFVRAVSAIRKIVADKKINILHSHSYWTNIISRFAAGNGVKLINHYHFADYDTMNSKQSVRGMILLDKMTDRKSLVRVAVSEYVSKILTHRFPKERVKLIPNFIHCQEACVPKKDLNQKELRVVAVGNCNLEKNYTLVLQAFADLKEEPVSIDIIGGGGRLNFYRNEAKRMGLTKVRFCGIIPQARDLLTNYDLFLSASISETFGLAVLEGLCAKLPLVISDIPAFNEIAPTGSHFFNPYDKNDLANKLRNFLNDPVNIDTVEYERILQKYSCETFLSELKNLYNN